MALMFRYLPALMLRYLLALMVVQEQILSEDLGGALDATVNIADKCVGIAHTPRSKSCAWRASDNPMCAEFH
jgi:hypothetical protein